METIGTPLLWTVFAVVVAVSLVLDLFVFHRKAHTIRFREAMWGTVFWIVLSLAFNLWLYYETGSRPALEFLTGYVIEKALSVDNIFVFLVIFHYFAVPDRYQHRVLYWGVVGAIVLRGVFVALGAALLSRFHWVIYVFGVFLVVTGARLMVRQDAEVHPERNPVVRLARRYLPLTDEYHGQRFFVTGVATGKTSAWKWAATPLLLVLLVVEATDVVFAVDSIPAIFAVTRDPFIVFTSNIFAVLGLRALYFVLADLIDRFVYLKLGLGLVLVFVGCKMLGSHWVEIPVELSLAVVVTVLAVSMIVSWIHVGRTEQDGEGPRPETADEGGNGHRTSDPTSDPTSEANSESES